MCKKNIACFLGFILFFLGFNTVTANEIDRIILYEDTYDWSSTDLNEKTIELVKKYPELLSYELLGFSYDKKPIYVVKMGNVKKEEVYDHYLIEAGTHAREIANPAIVLTMIEDYALDFYNDNYISDFSVKELLETSIIHFYILSNPDGFDLVKIGQESIATEDGLFAFLNIKNEDEQKHKANIRGVDLNYNFETVVYNLEKDEWIDESILGYKKAYATEPTNFFYPGEYPGSEVETQLLQEYVRREDFRFLISYHSTGRILYWGNTWLSEGINMDAQYLASTISDYTGYELMEFSTSTVTGYFSDYFEAITLKPGITIETYQVEQPTPKSLYRIEEYFTVRDVSLETIEKSKEIGTEGYYDYKLYVNGKYFMDFKEIEYAKAFAIKHKGYIVKYPGRPKLYTFEIASKTEHGEVFGESLKAIDEFYNIFFENNIDHSQLRKYKKGEIYD